MQLHPPTSPLFPYTTLFRSDIVSGTTSFWGLHNAQFWEVTQCQWQKRLDPAYDTYGSGTGTYNYVSRLSERSEEHTSELQSHSDLVCRLLLEKKKKRLMTCT